jgi:hypothetical protein
MTVVPLTVSKNELQKHTYMLKKYLFKLHSVHQLCLNLSRDCIGGIMVSVLASSAVDRGFEPWLVQTKDYKIGICCFSAKHGAFRRKSKDWLARNQNNVSEWSDISTRGLLFQWASTIKIQLKSVCLVQSGPHHHHLIEN